MIYNNRSRKWQLLMTAVCFLSAHLALASNAPLVTGSYQVVQNKAVGSQSQIRLRIQLVNHGSSDFSIQRITLWSSSHAGRGGTAACAVALHAGTSSETTQQFTIQRSDYKLWERGFRPRLVLKMAGPGRTRNKAVVRLDRISGQEAK